MEKRIEELLEMVRPRLAMHGGNVSLIGYDEKSGVVQVKMEGACSGCPLSQMTLKGGIEALIVSELPQVKEVIAIS